MPPGLVFLCGTPGIESAVRLNYESVELSGAGPRGGAMQRNTQEDGEPG